MQQLKWIKCQADLWCPLHTVNLAHEHFNGSVGVYIVWHAGQKAHTIKVGQGDIRAELTAARRDGSIRDTLREEFLRGRQWLLEPSTVCIFTYQRN